MSEQQGKLIIFAGPSGTGKTTIAQHLLAKIPELAFSVSACSRPPRKGERDGIDYHFITIEEFKKKIEKGEFIEWEEVYAGSYYGTLRSEVERIWKNGKHAIFDIDVIGALNLKKWYAGSALTIFIQPPSLQALEERLRLRNPELKGDISERLEKAKKELTYAPQFDKLIKNENLETATSEAEGLVKEFLT